jgi:hypothetical protein
MQTNNMLKTQYVPVKKIRNSERNPRKIDKEQFEILCKSLKEDPEFLEARPILCDKDMIAFAGNMRLRAAIKIGLTEVPVIIMDLPKDKEKRLAIKDNVNNGQWDISMLTAEYETEDLIAMGMDLEGMGIFTDAGFDTEGAGGLPSGEKPDFRQMTFTLSNEQAESVQNAIDEAYSIAEEYDHQGNKNKNGNALYAIIQQWLQQRI